MYPVPPAPTPPGQKEVKPNLVGVRNKQRKGVQKAQAKFEPQAFRDQLTKHLESVPPGDFDAVAQKLDVLGNQLDYRKYEQQLFEVLLVGGLLAPGGGFIDDGSAKSSFSVIGSAKEPVEAADLKKIVDVFHKLMRRYKYLQKPFEETALRGILQYTNKFSPIDQEKLAVATSQFVSTGLASANVLVSLKKDHLVKDGSAVTFLTTFCKTYIASESVEHLCSSLRKGGVTDLEGYFPPSKQNATELSAHFKSAGLEGVVAFYLKQKSGQAKEDTLARLKEFVAEEADYDEILTYLEAIYKRAVLTEPEFISIVWTGLMTSLDMTTKPELLPDLAIKEIQEVSPLLEPFCQKPATEVALINTIQIWCYENTKLMNTFPKILKVLYSTDVLSDQAIIYWHAKGAKTQGKQHFLNATTPLVNFLKEQEDSDEEEDDE
ncbi:hypothetical protein BCR35DRAFT_311290 [Leucosporidium creatinivorum]|uniref:W2 domain-containing protein n=1 Tax=Leucosporidium creatinivorum TaxID=106004 RepID=A0A1Y2C520_9BASI|nr:hypothetical protein BCR35DRAFT_311290 [Leucosporidium creatinivorum]